MKGNYFNNILIGLVMLTVSACEGRSRPHASHANHDIDSVVLAAIKPTNTHVISDIATITPETGTRIMSVDLNGRITYDPKDERTISSRVAGRIERLYVKYNYQKITKGQLLMEIYSADLASAQRELLYLHTAGDKNMASKAVERLKLMGMGESAINRVIATGKVIYKVPVYSNSDGFILEKSVSQEQISLLPENPGNGGMNEMGAKTTTPAYPSTDNGETAAQSSEIKLREGQYISAGASLFVVYGGKNLLAEFAVPQGLASNLSTRQKILFYPQHNKDDIHQGLISVIEPVFRNGQNYHYGRVHLQGKKFQAGELITGKVAVIYKNGWWLPRAAVWFTGDHPVVFKKSAQMFEPVHIKVKAVHNELVLTETDMSNWIVASNASFLADSEGFIDVTDKNKSYEE